MCVCASSCVYAGRYVYILVYVDMLTGYRFELSGVLTDMCAYSGSCGFMLVYVWLCLHV